MSAKSASPTMNIIHRSPSALYPKLLGDSWPDLNVAMLKNVRLQVNVKTSEKFFVADLPWQENSFYRAASGHSFERDGYSGQV
jgi:hypothetical protein